MADKYGDYQKMIAQSSPVPTVSPWRYSLTIFTSRAFGFGLATVDAIVSFKGMRDLGIDLFSSVVGASFIAVTQMAIAIALTSGLDIGRNFELRFFGDRGKLAGLKKALGYILIFAIVGMYLTDLLTNYAAFTAGVWVPQSGNETARAAIAIVMSFGLVFGDELAHLLADENAVGAEHNLARHQSVTYQARLQARYQRHYLKEAQSVADQLGAEHGKGWRPGQADRN